MRPIPRRSFLKVAGLTALGVVGADRALGPGRLGGVVGGTASAAAPDAIEQLAASFDYDVERIFRFVADEIRYEPYHGILRGARGTLASRAGNSADQAALLAALLEASAVPVRFRLGRLDDAGAEAIMAGTALGAAAAAERAAQVLRGSPVGPAPERPRPDDPQLAAALARLPEIAEAARDAAEVQVESAVTTIVNALATGGIQVSATPTSLPDLEREQHVWVQAAAGTGYVDLDPTPPAAEPGQVIAFAASEPLAVLPDELRHRVELDVIAERVAGGALTQESLVSHSAPADELAGLPIVLLHEKPAGLQALGVQVTSALVGTSQYQPILQVGDRSLIGLTGLAFGGGGGILGDLDADGSTEGEATAEWLEIRLAPPGGSPTMTRRTLFDRVGEAARASASLDLSTLEPVQLVDLDETSTAEYLPLRTIHFLAVATGATSGNVIAVADATPDGLSLFERSGHLYHLGRDAMSADLALSRGVRAFLDAPNVVSYSLATGLPSGDVLPLTASLDILSRSFGHLPVSDVTPRVAPGIVSGVVSHVAERIALGDGLPPDIATSAPLAGVGAVFDEALARGIGVRLIRDAIPSGLPYSPEVVARLEQAASDGWVVIVPERPVTLGERERLGWWLVDPRTGRTLDELDDGGAAEMVEYTTTVSTIPWRAIGSFAKWGLCLAHLIHEVHLVFELVTGQLAGFVYGFVLSILTHKLGHWACR